MKTRMCLCVGCAAMLVAGGALAQGDIWWNAAVDGLYTDGAKWTSGNPPVTSQKAIFDKNGNDFTVTFPQDFTDDLSWTQVNMSDGKITFDTRGTSWIKPTTSDNNILRSDDCFKVGYGAHAFNLEGNTMQFGLVDALMSFDFGNNAFHATLESGLFNIYDADGNTGIWLSA